MGETAQEIIQWYEQLKRIGSVSFTACFLAAVFLLIRGKLWTTVRTLKNERKKMRKKKKAGILLITLMAAGGFLSGEQAAQAKAQEAEQTMEITASAPSGEWFRGNEAYMIFVRVRGKKPDKVCAWWKEGETERKEEWQEPYREEENCWEYQMVLETEEMEGRMQIAAVTGEEIQCRQEWQIKIDRKPPEPEVFLSYQEGENAVWEKWGYRSEPLYFQKEVNIACMARDSMSGIAQIHILSREVWVEAAKAEPVEIEGKRYDAYQIRYTAPFEGAVTGIRLIDHAGNETLLLGEAQADIVVDQDAPVCLPFAFSEAQEKEGVLFFSDRAEITVKIQEKYWREQDVPIFINGQEADFAGGSWEKTAQDQYQNRIILEKEGIYSIEIGPVFDHSGNKMDRTAVQKIVIDRTPPILLGYEIEADGNDEEGSWYTCTGKIRGTIKIKESWFAPERMSLFMSGQETKEERRITVKWDWNEQTAEAVGSFETEEIQQEDTYCFEIEGTDLSGNPIASQTEQKRILLEGSVTVDRTAPEIFRIEWQEKRGENNGNLYFQTGVKGCISIEEKGNLKEWNMFEKREGEEWKPIAAVWREEEKIIEFEAEPKEGSTRLMIAARDLAGNSLSVGGTIRDFQETEEGIVSKNLVIDRTPPSVEIFFYTDQGKPIAIEQWQRDNKISKGQLTIKIRIQEENFDPSQWNFQMYACDKKGETQTSQEKSVIRANEACRTWTARQREKEGWEKGNWYETQWTLKDEANYTVTIQMKDFSDNSAVFKNEGEQKSRESYQVSFTIDQTAPVFLSEETQYKKEDQTVLERYAYRDYPYFSDQKIHIFLKARDGISGVKTVRFQLAHADNQIWTEAQQIEKGIDEMRCMIEVPVGFSGEIWVQAVDGEGVIGEKEKLDAVLIQTTQQAAKSSILEITQEKDASREKDGIRYYPGDVSVLIHAQDKVSGIKRLQCLVNGKVWSSETYTQKEERVFEANKRLELTQELFGEESITVEVEMETNSGYRTAQIRRYLLDSQAPVINIVYERGEGKGSFDRTPRTAQITVSDKNLDDETLLLEMDSAQGKPVRQSEWEIKEQDGKRTAVCTALFEEEDTYRMTVSAEDLSGNQAKTEEEAFTLDCTKPEIAVKKELKKGKTDSFYRGGGEITIFIEEKNFDPQGIFLELSGTSEDGKTWQEEWKETWERVEGGYQSSKSVEKEGRYLLYLQCEDLAGNRSREYGPDDFVIDKTVPEITIEEIEEYSANNGKVEPVIYLEDPYLDLDSLEISCTGEKWGEKKLTYTISDEHKRKKVSVCDFPHEKEQDDLYTVQIRIRDLAGNLAGKKICFSVNRFGSVYTFDTETKQFLEGYYQKEAKTLKILETNVDSLEENEIFCSRDGETKQMKKGTDYQVGIRGEKGSWKQYLYEISPENFAQEGVYQLTLMSKDQAGNYSDNGKNGEEIMFVIDHSSPTAVISGMEENGRYKEKKRSVWIDAADNIGIKEVAVFLDGALWKKWDQESWKEKAQVWVKEKDTRQNFCVKLKDLAGNESVYTIRNVLICEDSWIQFWNSFPKWTGGALILGGALTVITAAQKWRKRKKT